MKLIQIVPRERLRLYGAFVKKQAEIHSKGRGTFSRVGRKTRDAAKWTHVKFRGSVDLRRAPSEVVTVRLRSSAAGNESKLLAAFLGWVDRHFGDQLSAVNIEYR